MNVFETYDKLINGELRPNKRVEDIERSLTKITRKMKMNSQEVIDGMWYLNKASYDFRSELNSYQNHLDKINNKETDKKSEPSDKLTKKNEKEFIWYEYLIQFEFVRCKIMIKEFLDKNSLHKNEEYSIKAMQKLNEIYRYLKNFEKRIERKLSTDADNTTAYVFLYLKSFIEANAKELLYLFQPYLDDQYLKQSFGLILNEQQEMFYNYEAAIDEFRFSKVNDYDENTAKIIRVFTKAGYTEAQVINEINFWFKKEYLSIKKLDASKMEKLRAVRLSFIEDEVNKARFSGWLRGEKIDDSKVKKLYKYVKERNNEVKMEKTTAMREKDESDVDTKVKDNTSKLNDEQVSNSALSDKQNEDLNHIKTEMLKPKVKQRDLLRNFLEDNYPDIVYNDDVNCSNIAKEFITLQYSELNGKELQSKISSIRVEIANIRNQKTRF